MKDTRVTVDVTVFLLLTPYNFYRKVGIVFRDIHMFTKSHIPKKFITFQ
jgi:hypothetical protein